MVLTDTVGFIRKLPHHLVASFRATLEELHDADLLLHVIDACHPSWEEQREVVDDVLEELGAREKPMLYVFNKRDLLPADEAEGLGTRVKHLFPESVMVSSVTPEGLDPLREALRERVRRFKPIIELRLEHSDGKLLADLHRTGEVVEQRHTDDGLFVRVRLDAAALGRCSAPAPPSSTRVRPSARATEQGTDSDNHRRKTNANSSHFWNHRTGRLVSRRAPDREGIRRARTGASLVHVQPGTHRPPLRSGRRTPAGACSCTTPTWPMDRRCVA